MATSRNGKSFDGSLSRMMNAKFGGFQQGVLELKIEPVR